MPKIIENARGMLLDEAKRQIEENGYESVTVRSIAKGCSLGLGTFYNYFKSKDMLIASFLLDDWQQRIAKINEQSREEKNPIVLAKCTHDEIKEFIEKHRDIFTSPEAIRAFNNTVSGYHKTLRNQIAEPFKRVFEAGEYENCEFLAQFVAEAILTWTVGKKSFDELSPILNKLFVK